MGDILVQRQPSAGDLSQFGQAGPQPELPRSGFAQVTGQFSQQPGPSQPPQGDDSTLEPFVVKANSSHAYHAVHRKGSYRSAMEDTFSLFPQLLDLHIGSTQATEPMMTQRLKEQWLSTAQQLPGKAQQAPVDHVSSAPAALSPQLTPIVEKLSYFAVFDGHKGTSAAEFASRKLHENIKRRLVEKQVTLRSFSDRSGNLDELEQATDRMASGLLKEPGILEDHPVESMDQECKECEEFARRSAIEQMKAVQEQQQTGPARQLLRSQSSKQSRNVNSDIDDAISEAFLDTQRDFESYSSDPQVGTTATVALVGGQQLYIANVGDSRAVLCRGGVALPLSDDQKPERPDEHQRIKDAQGYVFYFGGAMRVFGKVAMTRAIGDTELQPYILPRPEVTIIDRSQDDEFLILATDGLWDVMDNQEACAFVQCIISKTRARDPDVPRKQQIKCATRMLVEKALKANTKDNVTAIVVDLDPRYRLP